MGNPLILFDNRFNDGPVTTTDMAAWGAFPFGAYPWGGQQIAGYLMDLKTFNFWQALDCGVQYLKVNCSGTRPANCLGISGHNLQTAGVQVSVECSNDNFASDVTVALAPFTPGSDKTLLRTFTLTHKKDWRLKISTGRTPVRIAILMIGVCLELPYPPDTPYVPASEGVVTKTTVSQGGHFLGAVVSYKPIDINFTISHFDRHWALQGWGEAPWGGVAWGDNGNLTALWNYMSDLNPFFYAWDFAVYPNQVHLLRMNPEQRHETPLSVLAYVDTYNIKAQTIKEWKVRR